MANFDAALSCSVGHLAVPLAKTSPRGGKYGRLFYRCAHLLCLHSNFLSIAQKAVERGELPPSIGIWPVHLVMAGAIAIALLVASGRLDPRAWLRPGKTLDANS